MSSEKMIAKTIQKITGESLVIINKNAFELMAMGLAKTRLEALNLMLEMAS
jgi:hypothetical protein